MYDRRSPACNDPPRHARVAAGAPPQPQPGAASRQSLPDARPAAPASGGTRPRRSKPASPAAPRRSLQALFHDRFIGVVLLGHPLTEAVKPESFASFPHMAVSRRGCFADPIDEVLSLPAHRWLRGMAQVSKASRLIGPPRTYGATIPRVVRPAVRKQSLRFWSIYPLFGNRIEQMHLGRIKGHLNRLTQRRCGSRAGFAKDHRTDGC